MVLGIGIGINKIKQRQRRIATGDPFASITVIGAYASREAAVTDGAGSGDYFVTTADNIYGLPAAILMRVPTFTSYDSYQSGNSAVGGNVVFQLSQENVHGLPFGTSAITYPSESYINDSQAQSGGVEVNELYVLLSPNFGKLIKQRTI